MNAFDIARSIHIAAGATALVSLGVPLATRKGGALHVRAGWVYVAATAVVAASAVAVCAGRLLDDAPANDGFATFLLYVALFSAASAFNGVRALGVRPRETPRGTAVDCGVALALAALGVGLAAYGVAVRAPLFVTFALLGTASGVADLRFWRAARHLRVSRFDAVIQHVSGLGASCIATITAFLVVNAGRFGLGTTSFVLWFGPGLVGGIAIAVWRARARARRARRLPNLSVSSRAPASARAGGRAR